jgi:glycosyltransferase involved in cell wall biosynthesis
MEPAQPVELSIITVNFNNADGLKKTIDSVASQKFPEFEYIIIDGGSTDGSVSVITDHAKKITQWVSEPDNGIYHAMNKGILKAKGKYLLFLNSGDYLAEENILQNIFSKPHTADILYGDLYINEPAIQNLHKFPENLSLPYLLYKTIGHPSSFIKKKLIEKLSLYDEKYKIVSDWKFFLQAIILERCSVEHLHIPVSVFVLDGLSSQKESLDKINNERERIKQEILTAFQVDFPVFDKNYRDSKLAKIYNAISKVRLQRKLARKIVGMMLLGKTKADGIKQSLTNSIKKRKFAKNQITRYQNIKEIPVVINNFNRLDCLKELLTALESRGYSNLIILDNASTYPPLLDFYTTCPYRLIRLQKNVGHLAIWQTEEGKEFLDDYYVYTDPDVVPVGECPDNFLEYFLEILEKYPSVAKVGFSLKLDDIPEFYQKKSEVTSWESQNFKQLIAEGLYDASIDTTFALYRPYSGGDWKSKAIRTGFPYTARHLPWYVNEDKLSEEELYYRKTRKQEVSQWT